MLFRSKSELRFSPRSNRAHEINWRPWDERSFEQAAKEKKPVLLSISAVWCHWCHVMDETSYSDDEVITLINRDYIPIRVDSDRNPDINRRYNQGGWPTTAFLSPQGVLLAGATYIPPENMRKVLVRMVDLYQQSEVRLVTPEEMSVSNQMQGKEPKMDLVRQIGELILVSWDRRYGGLGSAPKFPQTATIALALELFRDESSDEYLKYARSTMEAMIRGGLMDKVEGGFFRYSTTRDWSIPHYEKMLSDNADLLSVLIKTFAATGQDIFLSTAKQTSAYIRRTLSDGSSRFFGSQDADEEYYLLPAEGRKIGRAHV